MIVFFGTKDLCYGDGKLGNERQCNAQPGNCAWINGRLGNGYFCVEKPCKDFLSQSDCVDAHSVESCVWDNTKCGCGLVSDVGNIPADDIVSSSFYF